MSRGRLVLCACVLFAAGSCATRPPAASPPSVSAGPPHAALPPSSGPAIALDTMGVDFGPWVREFSTQIRRYWLIPHEAALTSGRVVVVVRVGRDGRIEGPVIKEPSPVAAFNDSAVDAIAGVKSTAPLPAGYPSDHADVTVTFHFSELPPQRLPPQRESRPPGDGSTRLVGRDLPLLASTTPPAIRGSSTRCATGRYSARSGWVQFWVQPGCRIAGRVSRFSAKSHNFRLQPSGGWPGCLPEAKMRIS